MRAAAIRWVVIVLALAACQADVAEPPLPQPATLTPAETIDCGARGGKVGQGGMLGGEVCFMPTPDAGKACTKAGDCSGMCLSETRTCSTETPSFGCFGFLDENGQKVEICVD